MTLDFTYNKYEKLLECISLSNIDVLTVREFFTRKGSDDDDTFIVLRHDVDLDPQQQVRYAELEHDLGISSSYYFRHTEGIFDEKIIDSIESLGHEIGYHYETLTKSRGDMKEAVVLFGKEFSDFREKWGSVTVCPHGGAYVEGVNLYNLKDLIKVFPKLIRKEKIFSRWKNDEIIEHLDIGKAGILGDAHVSVDFKDIFYLSDTGRSWQNRHKRLDKVLDSHPLRDKVQSTDDIIEIIGKGEVKKMYLTIHFEQWKTSFGGWASWYLSQLIRRKGKKVIHRSS